MSETEEFDAAAAYLRGIAGKLNSSDLLYFYARFKQSQNGPNKTPKPGFFDFQGKQKWQAWTDLGEMSSEQARQEYIDRLDEIDDEWRDKEPTALEKGWAAVSTMRGEEEDSLSDEQKTVFDWVKEGNLARVKAALGQDAVVDRLDEEGMGLLHWAADRGSWEIVETLLAMGNDINLRDMDGQTALHYAASCGHVEVVRGLLGAGIDRLVCDNDGSTAGDLACDEKIKSVLN